MTDHHNTTPMQEIISSIRQHVANSHHAIRSNFQAADHVNVLLSRDEPDWAPQVLEMANFCEAYFPGQWRYFAPITSNVVTFEFESSTHAVHFKLRWG